MIGAPFPKIGGPENRGRTAGQSSVFFFSRNLYIPPNGYYEIFLGGTIYVARYYCKDKL